MHTKSHGVRHHVIAALLLVTLVLASMAFAAPPQSGTDAAQAQRTSFGKTTYRVVNLTDGDAYGGVAINASDQVAFSYTADVFQFPVAAFFHDGAGTRNIGRLGNDYALATGINDSGQIVGQSLNAAGQDRAFFWSTQRPITEIGMLPDTNAVGQVAINSVGVVVGSMFGRGNSRAYRWSLADGLIDLGTLRWYPPRGSSAIGLNDAGVIVGSSRASYIGSHAFRWTFGSGMVDIHTLSAADSVAVGIDASGNIAGNYYDHAAADAIWHAFVWTPDGGMRALAYGADDVNITGMTSGGRVIGSLSHARTNFRAFTWTRAGGIVELGTLGGMVPTASGANNNGQVVGAVTGGSGWPRAFVWTAGTGMLDLNTRLRHAPPGLALYEALAISDNGAIVARANTGLVLLKPGKGGTCTCPPTVGPIMAPELTLPGAPFEASMGIAGDRAAARYKVTWSWGDGATTASSAGGSTGAGTRDELTPAGAFRQTGSDVALANAGHAYTTPGVYTVSATVVDDNGASVKASRKIVVPAAQGSAGAGTFISHAGAAPKTPHRVDRARFAFIAPSAYAVRTSPGSHASRGVLHFKVGDLDFRSTDIAPVAGVRGSGQFTGNGAINGKGAYRFELATTASTRDAPGRFGLKIWHADARTGTQVIDYNNQQSDTGQRYGGMGAAAASAPGGATGSALIEGNIVLL